jgi:acetyl esterase/lipase
MPHAGDPDPSPPPPPADDGRARASTSADTHVRSAAGPVRARVHWPARIRSASPPPMVVVFADPGADRRPGPDVDARARGSESADARARELCRRLGVVVVAVAVDDVAAGLAVVGWAADHAADLAADPARIVVVGDGAGADLATRVAARAGADGWPPIERLVVLPAGGAPPPWLLHALTADGRRPASGHESHPDPVVAPGATPPSPRTPR